MDQSQAYNQKVIALLKSGVKDTYRMWETSRIFSDDDIKSIRLYKPHWCTARTSDGAQFDATVRQMEILFPHVVNLIANEETAYVGLTLLYQIGRNFLVAAESAVFVYTVAETDDIHWVRMEEPIVKLQDFLSKSDSEDALTTYLREKYPSVTHTPSFSLARTPRDHPLITYLGFFGMIGALMARSMIKNKVSLDHLFNGEKSKLEQYFTAFYEFSLPYSGLKIKDIVLSRAAAATKTSGEARTLLLFSMYQRHKAGPREENRTRVMFAVLLQPIMYYGLPALSWAKKAAEAVGDDNFSGFLKKLLHPKTADSIKAIEDFNNTYESGTKGIYYPIAKILDSDYFKELGRDKNPALITCCYILAYHYAPDEEKPRLRRYKAPVDTSRFSAIVLKSFIFLKDKSNPQFDEAETLKRAVKKADEVFDSLFPTLSYHQCG